MGHQCYILHILSPMTLGSCLWRGATERLQEPEVAYNAWKIMFSRHDKSPECTNPQQGGACRWPAQRPRQPKLQSNERWGHDVPPKVDELLATDDI